MARLHRSFIAALGANVFPIFALAGVEYTFVPVGPQDSTSVDITNSGYLFGTSGSGGSSGFYGNGIDPYKPSVDHARQARDAADGSLFAVGWGKELWNSRTGSRVISPSVAARDVDRLGRVSGSINVPGPGGQVYNGAFVCGDFGRGPEMRVLPHFGYVPERPNNFGQGAMAISNTGYAVGGLQDAQGVSHAFVYGISADTFTALGPDTAAIDVNDDGKVLVTNGGLPYTGAIYDIQTGQTREMGTFGSYISNAINRWGQVVGARYSLGSADPFTPFIWEDGKFTNLKPMLLAQGFIGWNATGVNDKGQIALWGHYRLDGPSQAVILNPKTGTSSFFPEAATTDAAEPARFTDATGGRWFAAHHVPQTTVPAPNMPPPAPDGYVAQGYHFAATGDTRFAQVIDFPRGFEGAFRVSVGEVELGTFAPGQALRFSDFSTLLGDLFDDGGVEAFDVTGIRPLSDFPTDFALQLAFDSATGEFAIAERNNLLGDIDGNGLVNFGDFLLLSAQHGSGATGWYAGDFNFDGVVDRTDVALLVENVNVPLAPHEHAAIAAFVPEPVALCHAAAAAGLLSCRRPRRRSRLHDR